MRYGNDIVRSTDNFCRKSAGAGEILNLHLAAWRARANSRAIRDREIPHVPICTRHHNHDGRQGYLF